MAARAVGQPEVPAPHYTFTLSDPTPTVGAKFGVNVSGVDANTAVTLAITSDSASVTDGAIGIAGTKSFQNMADAAGFGGIGLAIGAGLLILVLAVMTLAAGLLALAACTSEPARIARPSPTSSVSPSDPVAYAAQIVQGTNEVRRAKGFPALVGSVCAQDAAVQRATALIGKTELTHAPLGGVIADCASGTTAAENLSRAPASPAAVIDAWMHSPGHRSNLLDPALTRIGVGCVLDGGSMLCSQVFLGP